MFKSPNRYGSWNRITTADGSRLQTDNRSDIQLLGIGARDVESVFGLFAKIQKLTIAFDDDFHVLTDKMKWLIDECVSHETTWLGVVQTCSNDYDVLDLFLELLDEILERPKVCSNIIKRISMGKPFGDAILSDFDENAQPEEKEYGDMVYDLHAKAAKLERRIPIEVLELGDIYSAMHMHVGPMLTYVCLEIFECVNTLGLTEIPLNLQSGGQTVPAIVQLLPRVNAVTHLYMDACSDVGLCLVLLDIFAPAGNLHSLRIPITCFSSEDWSRNVFKALSTHKQLSRLEFVAGRCAGQVEDIMRSFVPPIIGDRIPASVHTFAAHGCGNLGMLLGWIPPTCVRVTVSGVVEKDQEFATGIGIRAATGVASQTKYMDVRIHEWSKYAIMSDPLVIKYIIGAYPNLVDLKYANDNVSVVELPKPSEYDKVRKRTRLRF